MNRMKIISVATLLAMGVVTGASAQQRGDRGDRDDHRGGPRQEQMQNRGGPGDHRGGPQRGYDRSGPGAGPDHNWRRGDRLPPQYRSRQYVVDDWRGHRLSAPPRGYHWVQTGGDYVLVAVATGIIASLLLNQ